MTILDLLHEDKITTQYGASTHGGEYKSPCPACYGTDRFCSWPNRQDGVKRTWFCRGCNKGGDDIEYLRHSRNMSYSQACAYLGVQPATVRQRHVYFHQPELSTRKVTQPTELWLKKAETFVAWAEEQLLTYLDAPVWERLAGLQEETIRRFRLGFNSEEHFRSREEWGLKTIVKDDGTPKKLWLPVGLVIPHVANGKIVQVKIRLGDSEKNIPYLNLQAETPCFIPCSGDVFVVVESDLDAILLWQEVRDLAGVVSLGSVTNPDKEAVNLLRKAKGVLIALDSDEAGGKKAWQWWTKHFPNAKRCMIPKRYGKDPGEAHKNGLDLRMWVKLGLESLGLKQAEDSILNEEKNLVTKSDLLNYKVKAIESRAYELGWKQEQLWNTEGYYDKQGLICFLEEHKNIGEVTERFIEIYWTNVHGQKIVHKYYNHNIDQPWLKYGKHKKG